MTLFRLLYIRPGYDKLVGTTFAAPDVVTAVEFAEWWESITKCPVLTMKALPPSRFNVGTKKNHRTGELR